MGEQFRALYCDPGEDFGWCMGLGTKLLAAGTDKMWPMADDIWDALNNPQNTANALNSDAYIRAGVDPEDMTLPIGRVVCEDFRIYPWKAKELSWDPVRTARVIGAITFMCRTLTIPLIFQGANIKAAAVAAGAEELFYRPLRENRHQNDAIMHHSYYVATELMGMNIPIPEGEFE